MRANRPGDLGPIPVSSHGWSHCESHWTAVLQAHPHQSTVGGSGKTWGRALLRQETHQGWRSEPIWAQVVLVSLLRLELNGLWEGTSSVSVGVLVRGQLAPGHQHGRDGRRLGSPCQCLLCAPGPGKDYMGVRGLERPGGLISSAGRTCLLPPLPSSITQGTHSFSGSHPGRLHPKPGYFLSGRGGRGLGRGLGAGQGRGLMRGWGQTATLCACSSRLAPGAPGPRVAGVLLPPGVTARVCTLWPSPVGLAGAVSVPGRPTPRRSFQAS